MKMASGSDLANGSQIIRCFWSGSYFDCSQSVFKTPSMNTSENTWPGTKRRTAGGNAVGQEVRRTCTLRLGPTGTKPGTLQRAKYSTAPANAKPGTTRTMPGPKARDNGDKSKDSSASLSLSSSSASSSSAVVVVIVVLSAKASCSKKENGAAVHPLALCPFDFRRLSCRSIPLIYGVGS